ncbi:hypothetical protein GOBAR_AA05449 [Gossypium barbadense]|uniref:Uncharacterized protein n=1 Tax=Gossypium barbadense TaxID=3634 RepID=A0A2P5YHR9_GOSBA|nr:hypothetical protein GOBAR_AA05449 [Gossypium barbadense]
MQRAKEKVWQPKQDSNLSGDLKVTASSSLEAITEVNLDLLDQVTNFEVFSSKIDEVPGSSDLVDNEDGDERQVSSTKKNNILFLSIIYASNDGVERSTLWSYLDGLKNQVGDSPWMLGEVLRFSSGDSNHCQSLVWLDKHVPSLLKLKTLTRALKVLNFDAYSDITMRVKEKKAELEAIQLAVFSGGENSERFEQVQAE